MQFTEHTRQLGARHMKKRSVREDAVEIGGRQLQREKILMPYLAAARIAGHVAEVLRAVEPDRLVTAFAQGDEIATGSATEIENRRRRRCFDVPQQRIDV